MKISIIYGDIGGTKTLLQLAEIHDGDIRPVLTHKYPSQDFPSFLAILQNFLKRCDTHSAIVAGCFAIAGPVINHQHVKLTNLSWYIDSEEIMRSFSIPHIRLLNDFEAAALGIDVLSTEDILTLQAGYADSQAMRVILGAGTGMGVAWSVCVNERYYSFSTEAGHIDFAPVDDLQIDLLKFLRKKFRHVSVERLLSGSGLTEIFRFLHEKDNVHDSLLCDLPQDSGAIVTDLALRNNHMIAMQSLEIFVAIYGAYAGNLALAGLCRGGVFVAGGIAPKIHKIMTAGRFMQAFCDKGRFSQLMQEIPVYIVTNPEISLLGARSDAYDLHNTRK